MKGDVGAVGPQGEIGPTGAQGPQGVAGPQGADGVQGPMGFQGPAGPQGLPGVRGYEVVFSPTVPVPITVGGGATLTVLAVCPAGKIVIGGGHEFSTVANGQIMVSSFPSAIDTWKAAFRVAQITPASITAKAYAICVNQ